MTPRRRGLAGVLALALVGGVLGVAAAGAVTDGPQDAPPAAVSAAAAAPDQPPQPAAPGPVAPTGPGPREGFAPSLALPAGSAAGGGSAAAGTTGDVAAATQPVSVAVPRIGVDTPLVALGIAADGSLEVPGRDQFDLAGWLTTSAVPGRPGASVVAGHVDSTSGPAVFYRLHELVAGDEVLVGLADGSSVAYTVDEVRAVGKDDFPTADVYGPQPGPVLRLITCGGPFDRATGHYTDNVIAFASLR